VSQGSYSTTFATMQTRYSTLCRSGETVDDAIKNYRRDHLFFLQKRMELEDDMIATEANDELREAITKHRKEVEQMRADFEEKGLRIIGVEVSGKARDIQDFGAVLILLDQAVFTHANS
jgi:hypothetical protein